MREHFLKGVGTSKKYMPKIVASTQKNVRYFKRKRVVKYDARIA